MVIETYSDLKVHHLLRKRAHLIVEAEPVFANVIRRKHKVTLALLGAIENDFISRADDRVIYVERTARLDLYVCFSLTT